MKFSLRFLLFLATSLFAAVLCSCLRNSGLTDDIGTWSFSGVVVDGSTEKPLSGVRIEFLDSDGEVQSRISDSNGKFFIDNIPYGERSFIFTYDEADTGYTSKKIIVASYAEASSLGGVIGDVSKIIRLYPLTGSVRGKLVYQYQGTEYQLPARSAMVCVVFQDSSMLNAEPATFSAVADTLGNFELKGLPLAPGGVITFDNYATGDKTYTLSSKSLNIVNITVPEDLGRLVYTTTDSLGWSATILVSNVLSADGYGRTGVSVIDTIWYKLPVELQPGSVEVRVNESASSVIVSRVEDDTLFLIPAAQLPYDTLMEVQISGFTEDGVKFDLTLDGISRFRTEKSAHPVEANFWSQPWVVTGRFGIGQAMWVRFSEELDTAKSGYDWATSSASSTVFGSGVSANANVRISGDTLFVTPDQRLSFAYNSTIGFNVMCRTVSGKYTAYFSFFANTIEDPLYLVWTNTKDKMGRNRVDMGLRDTLKILPSVSEFEVIGVSGTESELMPPGLMLSDIRLSGDTIICVPSLSLLSDTSYGLDFDLQLSDGTIRRNVLPVSWSTKKNVFIVSTDTKRNGMYRPLAAIGDSFKVTFSESIDTSINAAVAFRVNIKDVKDAIRRSVVKWDKECLTATIRIIDTLPVADFDAPAAYTATAVHTKAVESVTFDLVTRTGEQVIGCKPDGTPISLHTEKGLCIIQTNIIPNLDGRTSVEKEFAPRSDFPLDSAVYLQFNRVLDTSAMRMDSLEIYAGIQKAGAVIVPADITMSSDRKTIRIMPEDHLDSRTEYYIWVRGVPAAKISGAAAINKHGGTFSGKSASGYLLERPFKTR